jgi:pimeloyl-ACP methyl ester carboxylesterase
MRSLPCFALLWCVALGLLLSGPAARAADNKTDKTDKTGKGEGGGDKVRFESVDHVTLEGNFYAPMGTGKSKQAPAVLMLHKIGKDSSQDGWDSLARDLQKAGYAVLTFDFRGHGNSTAVTPEFWNDTTTLPLAALTKFNREQYNLGYNPNKPKETISIKDFKTSYYPALVNDIAAAKAYLDRRNDNGDCNSSNLILIGAEDGATLGAGWMVSELYLYRVASTNFAGVPTKLDSTPEGKEIAAAVWLSMNPSLGSTSVGVKNWIEFAGKERKIPMAFVCGEKERTATFSKSLFNAAKPAKDAKGGKLTGEKAVADSKLSGSALLGDQVMVDKEHNVRDWIVDVYLKAVRGEQVAPDWTSRDNEKTPFAWALPGSRQTVWAKQMNEKTFAPVPFTFLH